MTGTYQGTTKVNAAQFDAFGRVSSSSGTFRNPYGYSGEYTDATGLQYLRARYYNPELGRFTQQDTWRDQGNPYVYCSNNPVVYTDPSGHCDRYGAKNVTWDILMISDLETEGVQWLSYEKHEISAGNAPIYEVTMKEGSDLCVHWRKHCIDAFAKQNVDFGTRFSDTFGTKMKSTSGLFIFAGGLGLADTPAPGIGDLLGAGVAVTGIIYVLAHSAITAASALPISLPEINIREKDTTTEDDTPIYIYRHNGTNPGNLVPSQNDVDSNGGLSFRLDYQPNSFRTTIAAINATGFLFAVKDGKNHVSVYPLGGTIKQWRDQGSQSVWTQVLLAVCEKVNKSGVIK